MRKKINHPHLIWLLAFFSLFFNFFGLYLLDMMTTVAANTNKISTAGVSNNDNKNANNSLSSSSNSNSSSGSSSKDGKNLDTSNNGESQKSGTDNQNSEKNELTPVFSFDLKEGTIFQGEKKISGSVENALGVEFYLTKIGSIDPKYFIGKAENKGDKKWELVFDSKQMPDGEYELFAKIKNQYGVYTSDSLPIKISNYQSSDSGKSSDDRNSNNDKNDSNGNNGGNSNNDKNSNDSGSSGSNSSKAVEKPTCSLTFQSSQINVNESTKFSWNFGGGYTTSTPVRLKCTLAYKEGIDLTGISASGTKTSIVYSNPGTEICYIYFNDSSTPSCSSNSLTVISKQSNGDDADTLSESAKIKSEMSVIYQQENKVVSDTNLSDVEKKLILNSLVARKQDLKRLFVSRQEAERILMKNEQQLSQEEKEKIQKIKEQLKEDSDGDGLPDAEEERLGTDIFSADTDGDGYLDGDEVANGFDPLTPSQGNKNDKIVFEEPKEAGKHNPLYEVNEISYNKENVERRDTSVKNDKKGLKIKGKALPSSFVTLYIYSSPIVVTVKADENGNWEYVLTKELEDGEHQVYAAVTDNKGKITSKSEGFSFVKRAQAIEPISKDNLYNQKFIQDNASPIQKTQVKIAKFVLIFSFFSLFLAITSIVLFLKHREFFKKKIDALKNNE